MHEREHGESQEAAPAVPERPLAAAQHAGILRLQSTIGNRATARLIAREEWEQNVDAPKNAVLVSFDAIEATYVSWHKQKARSLRAKVNDPKVMAAASAATKTQVGPMNYERWLKQRGGLFLTNVTIGPIEYKDKATEDAEKPKADADWSPEGRFRSYQTLNARALKLNKGVVAVEVPRRQAEDPRWREGLCVPVRTGGVRRHVRRRRPQPGLRPRQDQPDTAGLRDGMEARLQQGEGHLGQDLVVDGRQAVGRRQEVRLRDGQHDHDLLRDRLRRAATSLYLQTRPSYNRFKSALETFYGDTGTTGFNRGVGMMQELEALGVMTGAVAQMETSAAEYANIVQTLGVIEKAGNIAKLSAGIEGGMVNSVEIAVDMLAGGLIGGEVSVLGKGPGKLIIDEGLKGKGVIEPLLEVGKAGAKEATAKED